MLVLDAKRHVLNVVIAPADRPKLLCRRDELGIVDFGNFVLGTKKSDKC